MQFTKRSLGVVVAVLGWWCVSAGSASLLGCGQVLHDSPDGGQIIAAPDASLVLPAIDAGQIATADAGILSDAPPLVDASGCTPHGTRVQDVQSDAMPVGTPVELDCVVVTAIDTFGATTGDIWVADLGGGAFSGVRVFKAVTAGVADLAVGDLVNITGGSKLEFPATATSTFGSVTEVQAPAGGQIALTRVGTGAPPAPHVLALNAFASMSVDAQNAEYEKWEGVLITVNNAAALTVPTGFGVAPVPVDAFGVDLPGSVTMDSALAAFPDSVAAATCFTSITGVVDFAGGKWLLFPRTTPEMVVGNGCPGAPPATVTQIQTGAVIGLVKLSSVFVTAQELSTTGAPGKRMWVADSLKAAANNGMLVFFNSNPVPALPIGSQIDVTGVVLENGTGTNKITEINDATATLHAAAGAAPTPLTGISPTTLGDPTNGEPYEGVLVQISDLRVTATAAANQVTLVDNLGATIVMDDDAFDNYSGTSTPALPAVGTCFASITGVMNGVSTATSSVRTINPRSAADLVAGNTCN